MTTGVDFLELFNAHFGVDRGGVEFLVTEQLLDKANVSAVLQHVCGATVPQHVAAAFAFERGLFEPGGDHAREDIRIEGFAVAGQEQRLRARVQTQAGAHFFEITFEPVNSPQAHRHHAVFFALALADVNRAALRVQVGQIEAAKLGAAHSG